MVRSSPIETTLKKPTVSTLTIARQFVLVFQYLFTERLWIEELCVFFFAFSEGIDFVSKDETY